jgi:putative Mg2+ transporter-C (MgtC) family protein
MIHELDFLRNLTFWSVCLRIALSVVAGFIIGAERRNKNHAAGLRTHMLVTVGSALLMITSQFAVEYFGAGDVMRIGAQAVSGIGFLGAGTIIISKGKIRGLTTAAGLWATTCIGLAIGIGFYEGAIIGLAAVFFTLVVLRRLSHKNKSPKIYGAEYLVQLGKDQIETLSLLLSDGNVSLSRLEIKPCGQDLYTASLSFNADSEEEIAKTEGKLREIEGALIFEIQNDGQAAVIGD